MGSRECLPWSRRTWGGAGGASPVHLNTKPEEDMKVWHCTPAELMGWFFLSFSSLNLEIPQTLVTSLPAVSWDLEEDYGVGSNVGGHLSSPIPASLPWQKYSMATSTGCPRRVWAPRACGEEALPTDRWGANWQRKLVLHSHFRLQPNLSLLPLFRRCYVSGTPWYFRLFMHVWIHSHWFY